MVTSAIECLETKSKTKNKKQSCGYIIATHIFIDLELMAIIYNYDYKLWAEKVAHVH